MFFQGKFLLLSYLSSKSRAYISQNTMTKSDVDESYDNEKEPRKVHNLISAKKKLKLIELVEKSKLTIYKAAKRLKICHPTAKFIMKNHRKSQAVKVEEDFIDLQPPETTKKPAMIQRSFNISDPNCEVNDRPPLVQDSNNVGQLFYPPLASIPSVWTYIPQENYFPFFSYPQ